MNELSPSFGREVCARCRRPTPACYCAHLTSIETRTRLVFLQHPRERDMPIGTAHMASLCLPNSELHVGIDWSRSNELARALSDPARPPVLLYPGDDAIDIVASPPSGPVTLIVVDGTWWQTRKVVRTNPLLSSLPRYAFVPPRPSEYRIRREPADEFVATIEALVHVLGALEGDTARFETMLRPFRAMIDFQIACAARFQNGRLRHAKFKERRPSRNRVPNVFTERQKDLVYVVAEANSWPYTERTRHPDKKDELVLFAAHRPSTGETFAEIAAPRAVLAPGTSLHTGVSTEALFAGGSLDALLTKWRAFVRDDDVICSWGHYEGRLFLDSGGFLPKTRVDLRTVARDVARGKVGSLEEYAAAVAEAEPEGVAALRPVTRDDGTPIPGRAGRKLDALRQIVASFLRAIPDLPSVDRSSTDASVPVAADV